MKRVKKVALYLIAAIVLVALVLGLPYLFKKISADTETTDPTTVELLKDNDFTVYNMFDPNVWTRLSNKADTKPVVFDNALNLEITSTSKKSYIKIAQPVELKADTTYQAVLTFSSEVPDKSPITLQFGITKDGPSGEVVKSFIVTPNGQLSSNRELFKLDQDYLGQYFFVKILSGKGKVMIQNISLKQSGNASTVKATTTPTASATTTSSTTPTVTPTAVASQTPVSVVAPTQVDQSKMTATFKQGWNVLVAPFSVKSQDLNNKGLYVFEMLSGSWQAMKPGSKTSFNSYNKAGLYVYSSSEKEVTLDLNAQSGDTMIAGKGWNVLSNNSESDQDISKLVYNFSKNGANSEAKSHSLSELIGNGNASGQVYFLKQTDHGVSLNKVDLKTNPKVPAKSAFWFFVYNLEK